MSYKLRVTDEAEREFEEIVQWYREQSQQATNNFFVEFDKAIERIKTAPHRYRNRSTRKDYREIQMKKFHYYIIFCIEEEAQEAIVLRLYHTSRNPKKKYRNL